MSQPDLALWLERLAIAELAQTERMARDTRQWELMLRCYHTDSRVFLSWFDGTAADFVTASRKMGEEPGGHAIHELGPTLVTVHGDRALADTSCTILMRRMFGGVECDLTSYCRHRSRVERLEGTWRLRTFVGIYEKNTLAPVIPGTIPVLDTGRLASYRESYNYQCYYREDQGKVPFSDRPGIDRPDLVQQLLEADKEWLAGANAALGAGSRWRTG